MKKYRKQGYGRILAHHIFDSLKGKWEVFQMKSNVSAGLFWENVIAGYTHNAYTILDTENDDGQIGRAFVFNS